MEVIHPFTFPVFILDLFNFVSGISVSYTHLTIYLTLTAYFEGENVRYEFVRKVEDQIKIKRSFTELGELFKFLGDYLDPVSLGNLGVKIGHLGVKAE